MLRSPGVYPGVDERDYHADLALSHSGAKRFLEVAPKQWKWERDHPRTTSTDAFALGGAVHTIVLGAGARPIDLGVDEIRTDKAKDAQQAAWDAGQVPLRSKHYRQAHAMAAAVRRSPRACQLLATGEPELSVWYQDPVTGLMLRARADWVHWIDEHTAVIVDLKTSSETGPDGFARSVRKFGYFTQQPWYQDAFAAHGITTAFLFLVVCETAPHLTYFVELKDDAVDYGARQNRRVIDLFAQCVESGQWPDHGDDIHEIDLPYWLYKQEAVA